MTIDRRRLLTRGALAAASLSGPGVAAAQAGPGSPAPSPAVPPKPAEVTRILARYVVNARYEDLPDNVKREGRRTLLNWVGVAAGGSRHETVDKALAATRPFSGAPTANVLGRTDRLDPMSAALINGVSSHIFDYDDTHLKTIIHPAGPVASAILALSQHRLAQQRPVNGRDFLTALVMGVETECRIGNAVWPSHYDLGWHITGSCGMFGAAAACGKLLGLDEQKMVWALGVAGSQPVGVKTQFGTMTKSFHPGRAAQGGLLAALLAAEGYTASDEILEGKDGWAQASSRGQKWDEVTSGLGSRFEAALNTYKPYACGIVTHPGIDAAVQLRNENSLKPQQIKAVELTANPLVLSLTGHKAPQTGLDGKFSIYHCIAVGLIYGAAGERQFQTAVVLDPTVIRVRDSVTVRLDPQMPPEKSRLKVTLADGRVLERFVEDATGSLKKPMSDQALEGKLKDLVADVLPADKTAQVIAQCWSLDSLPDASVIARSAAL
jgi:2-methylcitrate dehydratase PrpD